jgi:hypothetical protein
MVMEFLKALQLKMKLSSNTIPTAADTGPVSAYRIFLSR